MNSPESFCVSLSQASKIAPHGIRITLNKYQWGESVSNNLWLFRAFKTVGLVLALSLSMNACASFLGFGGESWKEEVLLHDGQKLIVERSQTRGGNHEIGQEVPIAEHKVSFTLPGAHEEITWKSTYGYNRDNSNLILLALDVINGVPYIVTTTLICPAYNKWDRPNPPYVVFEYIEKKWRRVPLANFPKEIRGANVVINMAKYSGLLTEKEVKKINEENIQDDLRYLHVFVREPIRNVMTACSKFE